MNPDKYQQAWQNHSAETRVTIHANLLRKEVQRHQGNFLATIYWRDFREVGLALLMLPLWVFLGSKFSPPWTFYLSIPAIIWGAGFILVDRVRHPQKPSEPGESLVHCVKESLKQVEHQIWLLRNVFWWYLLPYSIPILIFFAHVCWLSASVWWEFVAGFLGCSVFVFMLYALLYYMNQYAVRTQLEPRRQELLTLLSSLGDETGRAEKGDADAYEIVPASVSPFSEEQLPAPRNAAVKNVIAIVCVVGLLTLIVPLLDLARQLSESTPENPPRVSRRAGDPLEELVSDLRIEKKLVGLAAMVMVDGKVVASAVDGQRMNGRDVPLEITDRWHLGGITKSITATMIARLVESGQMKWTDTVGEIFTEAPVHEDWAPVTITQLLTHTAGAPKSFSAEVRKNRPGFGPECAQARLEAVLDVIKDQPTHPPGTTFEYSNVGVTIAGAIAERLTGVTWEDLVQRNVFEPLELASAGFGPPKSSDAMLEQPRGHITRLTRKIGVRDHIDNTAIMAPSGAVHMTLSDLCVYATKHLRSELGDSGLVVSELAESEPGESVPVASELAESEPGEFDFGIGEFLSSETFQSLHTPELAGYACGWIKAEPRAGIPHTIYWHNGSNTMWYAFVAFIPETKMVVAVTSNDGDFKGAEAAAWEILKDVVKPAKRPSYLRRSPFTAVRWQGTQPEVMLDDGWFKLVSLNQIPVMDIVAFSQANYGELWQKRFEEDLVELLTRMEHPPQDRVTLEIRSLETDAISVRQEVPMTEANRKLIRNAAQSRAKETQDRAADSQ